MKQLGYGKGYAYDHDTAEGFSGQNYFPDGMERASASTSRPSAASSARSRKRLDYWLEAARSEAGGDEGDGRRGGVTDGPRPSRSSPTRPSCASTAGSSAAFPALAPRPAQKLLRTGQVRVDGARAKARHAACRPARRVRVPPLGIEARRAEARGETDRAAEDARAAPALVHPRGRMR